MTSLAFIIGTTLMYSTPLIFAALGGVISERAGIVNIGIEGMMTMGCFMGSAFAFILGNPWLGFFVAAVSGAAIAALHALATVRFAGNHVVSGIAMNFIGPALAMFISKLLFQGAVTTPASENTLPKVFSGLFTAKEGTFAKNSVPELILNQNITTYLAFFTAALMWFILYRTRAGLRIRSIGEHPRAAATLGVRVDRYKYICILLSGTLAGLGGASVSLGIVSNFRPGLISGQGFIALAAVIFGKWTPQGAVLACMLFGAANGLVAFLGLNVPVIPPELLSMLPYVLTLVVLLVFVGRSVGPAASGKPYESDR